MISKIYYLSLLLTLFSSIWAKEAVPRLHDEYDPEKWPKAELKLSQAATLKDIFDSGLRPYRHPGLENSLLEVKHLNLNIILGSGKVLPPLQVELVNITPFRDNEIATIEGFTNRLTLEEARAEMLKWLPYGENERTEEDLNTFLEAVRKDFLNFDDPYNGIPHGCGIGWYEPDFESLGGGPKCGFGFRKTASPTHPLRLYFGFDWGLNRPRKDRGSYRPHPIEPPKGYENVDMTAPKKIGPDSSAEILRSQGIDLTDYSDISKRSDILKERAIKRSPRTPQIQNQSKETTATRDTSSRSWKLWLIGLLILSSLGFFILLWKNNSTQ